MKLNRAKFVQHLERIKCAGQVKDAIFTEDFAVSAITPDQLLLVDAPGAPGAQPLSEDIGVGDLDKLIKALKLFPGEGNTGIEVEVYVKDNRLVIDDGARGIQKLILAATKTIGTKIDPDVVGKLFKAATPAEGGASANLTRRTLEGVASVFSLYKAEEVEIQVGKEGCVIRVGTSNTDQAEFPLDMPPTLPGYTLLFGKQLVDVFSIITDFSAAKVYFGGPGRPIVIEDGEYTYLLSPRARSADDAKPAVRKKRGKAAQAEEEEADASEVPGVEEEPAAETPVKKPRGRARASV